MECYHSFSFRRCRKRGLTEQSTQKKIANYDRPNLFFYVNSGQFRGADNDDLYV